MVYEINLNATFGKVIGYTLPLNPFSRLSKVIVRVNNRVIRIPVDPRQVKFIGKEYPIGSMVVLEYNDGWHIRSQQAPNEYVLDGTSRSVYY
jgi:hypothetical protein